jgi:RNA polymerase sigma-70 factor, ECF subfamily
MQSLPSLSDETLVERAGAGDQAAFRVLVERYEARVLATVTGMLGSCAEVDDVAQDTFIRFYKALRHFRGESAVATYLTRIAINQSLNALKRRKRWYQVFRSTEQLEGAEIDGMADYSHEAAEEVALVNKALQRLSSEHRAVVVLRLIDGYSTAETAEMLDVPQGTVLSRLSRAQRKLREEVESLMTIGHSRRNGEEHETN